MQKERKKERRRMFYSTATAECCVNRTTCRALKHAACCRAFGACAVDTAPPARCSVQSFRLGTRPKAQGTQNERTSILQNKPRRSTPASSRSESSLTRSLRKHARPNGNRQDHKYSKSAHVRRKGHHTAKTRINLTNNQTLQRKTGPRKGARGPPRKCGVHYEWTPQVPNPQRNPYT